MAVNLCDIIRSKKLPILPNRGTLELWNVSPVCVYQSPGDPTSILALLCP